MVYDFLTYQYLNCIINLTLKQLMLEQKQKLIVKLIIVLLALGLTWLIGYFTGFQRCSIKKNETLNNLPANILEDQTENNLPQTPPMITDNNAEPAGLNENLPPSPPMQ